MPPYLLRNHLVRSTPRRFFHASPHPQFLGASAYTAVETTLTATHSLLTTLHTTTGLPWFALIPISAVLLRLSITTPLTLYSRKRALKTLSLQPLVAAWQHPLARAANRNTSSPQAWEHATRKAVRAKRKEIWARHGCQTWKMWVAPLMQIPVWVAASVTLRGMTGREGMPEWVQRTLGPTATGAGEEGLGGAVGEGMAEVLRERIVPVEPSLAHEGALWFPNLLEVDPLMVLPMAFSFLIFANIEIQSLQTKNPSRNQRIISNALKLIPLVAFPIVIYQPAALTLYWSTSAAFSLVQNMVLSKVLKRPEELTPCKPGDPYMTGESVQEEVNKQPV